MCALQHWRLATATQDVILPHNYKPTTARISLSASTRSGGFAGPAPAQRIHYQLDRGRRFLRISRSIVALRGRALLRVLLRQLSLQFSESGCDRARDSVLAGAADDQRRRLFCSLIDNKRPGVPWYCELSVVTLDQHQVIEIIRTETVIDSHMDVDA